MKLFPRVLCLSLLTVLSACGLSPEAKESKATAIGTDLGTDGAATAETFLYWNDGASTFRGQCHWGKPILKVNCASNVTSVDTDTFQAALDNGVSLRVIILRGEVAKLIVEMTEVQKKIDVVLVNIAAKEDEVNADKGELAAAKARMQIVSGFISEYVEQLKVIDQELANMSDPDLLEQRAEIAGELAGYRAEMDRLTKALPGLSSDVAKGEGDLGDLTAAFVKLSLDLDHLTDSLQMTEASLTLAIEEFEAFQDTMKKLASAVIYTVKSENDSYAKNRPYVKRFDEIFMSVASSNGKK